MRFQCIICTDEYSVSSEIASVPCGHTFHQHCLDQWLKNNPSCPTCRARVRPRDVRKVFLTSLDASIIEPELLESNLSETRQKVVELRQKIVTLENAHSNMRALYEKSEANLEKMKEKYFSAAESAKSLKLSLKAISGTYEENAILRSKVEKLENLIEKVGHYKKALRGTEQEVEELLKAYGPGESSVRQIATYCVLIKRELESAKNEVRISRQQVSSLDRQKFAAEDALAEKNKELETATAEVTKFKKQCYALMERLENVAEKQESSSTSSSKRLSSEKDCFTEKRYKRSSAVVPSPPVLKVRSNLHSKNDPEALKIPVTKTLPGYTRMRITPTLRKPEAPLQKSSQDELLLALLKRKVKPSEDDSIHRKGYNGLGGHCSHIKRSR